MVRCCLCIFCCHSQSETVSRIKAAYQISVISEKALLTSCLLLILQTLVELKPVWCPEVHGLVSNELHPSQHGPTTLATRSCSPKGYSVSMKWGGGGVGWGGWGVFHLQLSHILLIPCTSWSCIRSQVIHLSSKFISCPELSGSDAFLPLPGSFNDRGMCPGFPRKTQILLPSTYPGLATAFPAYAITCGASLYAFTCLAVITHQRYVPGPD